MILDEKCKKQDHEFGDDYGQYRGKQTMDRIPFSSNLGKTIILLYYQYSWLCTLILSGKKQIHHDISGQHTKQPIDKSTTFFKLYDVKDECSMFDFAVQHYPNYQPIDGYGYYEFNLTDLTDEALDNLDPSLSVILMVSHQ